MVRLKFGMSLWLPHPVSLEPLAHRTLLGLGRKDKTAQAILSFLGNLHETRGVLPPASSLAHSHVPQSHPVSGPLPTQILDKTL